MTDTTPQTWTKETVEEIELQIGANLQNAATLLILGIEAEFFKITGDKSAIVWVNRVIKGSGFTFSRTKIAGELSKRDQAIVALIKAKATISDIADALGIGLATVHRVKTSQNLESVGGSKDGAGRTSDAPAVAATDSKSSDPAGTALERAASAIENVGKQDKAAALDMFALLVAQIQELSGVSAAELAERGAKMLNTK